MAAIATDIVSRIADLSDDAFGAFCEDIGGMFGVAMRCDRRAAEVSTAYSLREHFKKLAAVHLTKADGALNGAFHLAFDQGGLFILSGVVVMLPESRIIEDARGGSIEAATNLQDAVREVGNLLVGSWDRVFRESCPGHGHFIKANTFIGKPWEKPEQIELQSNTEVVVVLYEMAIDPYPRFTCAAVFPCTVLNGLDQTESAASSRGSRPVPRAPDPGPQVTSQQSQATEQGGGYIPPGRRSPLIDGDMLPSELASTRSGDFAAASHGTGLAFLDAAYIQSQPQAGLAEFLSTSAAEIMDKGVVWAGPEDTVQDVIAKMQQQNVGYVLIGVNGVLEGLVSGSNILGAVSLYLRPMFAKWRRPQDDATLGVKVKWVMSRPVRTVRPDATLAAMIETMRRCGGRCLPVVDAKGAVQGIVTVFDILLRILESDKSICWNGRPPQAPPLLI